ncbi:hypothetical protein Tco_0825311, partial [Tanacetum coccineum]
FKSRNVKKEAANQSLKAYQVDALRGSLIDQKLKKFIWLLFSKHFDIIAGNMA